MAIIPAIRIPKETTKVIALGGGLDQTTATLKKRPGSIFQSENFEVSWEDGYSLAAGYERFDGRSPKPSDAVTTYIGFASYTNTPTLYGTMTGQTSGATATSIIAATGFLSVTKRVGAFTVGEEVREGATVIGIVMQTPVIPIKTQAIHKAAAADYYRTLILPVPGSGPVRGVVTGIFNGVDEEYAFRDNAGGTAKAIYRATSSGWTLVDLGYTVSFTAGGAGVPADGDTLTQGGVTSTIRRVVFASGSWQGTDAAGRLIIDAPSGGNFAAGACTIGVVTATLSGVESVVTIAPAGRMSFHKFNFIGSTRDPRLYGVDGVGTMFEFDGVVFVPIITGVPVDKPTVVIEHKNYLFFGIGASMFHSAPGRPYAHSLADGAGEYAVGDTITNFNRQPASQESPALGVYGTNSTQFFYGNSPTDFKLIPFKNGVGAYPHTSQTLDHAYVYDRNGLIDYRAAEQFGNYVQSSLTVKLQNIITANRDKVGCSIVERTKSQYRMFFTNGLAVFSTIVNGKNKGSTVMRYPNPPNTCWEDIKSDGSPIALFGSSTDGFVYEFERGSSFDGAKISASLKLNWYYGTNPRMLKRWKRASLNLFAENYAEFSFGQDIARADLAYADKPITVVVDGQVDARKVWGQFIWGEGSGNATELPPDASQLEGTSENIQFTVETNSDYILPFTINTITVDYINRRLAR